MTKNIPNLHKILGLVDDDIMTKEEFIKHFKKLVDVVLGLKKEYKEKVEEAVNTLNEKIEAKMATMKDGATGRPGMNGLDGLDGIDGKDADEQKIVKAVLSQIQIPTAQEIIDSMPKEELNFDMVKGLKRFYKEFKNQRLGFGGGGFSNIAMQRHFIDDETPSGTVNGSNKAFTVSKTPYTGSLKVFVNGQRMRVTEDYTLSGKTITFVTAPPTSSILLVDYRF